MKRYKDLSVEEKKEYHRIKQREYFKKNPEKCREGVRKSLKNDRVRAKNITAQKEWRKNNPDYYKEYFKDEEHREKRDARNAINYHVKKNNIKQKDCSLCSSNEHMQKHHPDYKKPLKFVWLCKVCHIKLHRVHSSKL